MSTEGRSAEAATAPLERAAFVRVVTRADGDALAASGILARALSERATPFQVTVAETVAERTARATDADDRDDTATTLAIGACDADVARLEAGDRPATLGACDLARDLGATPDPVLALAGAAAAGVEPGAGETEWLLEGAVDRGLIERRPGVAVPTADPVDGLAHSTRCRAPWSGDLAATREALASVDLAGDLDESARERVASLVALDVVGDADATDRAAESIGRLLRPHATPRAPFETVGGYADVLAATARTEPGTGVALAMGHGAREAALDAWRTHGERAHAALDGASTGRYDGLFVVGIDDGPVETVARLAAAYRSPEPHVLAVGNGQAAIAALEPAALGPVAEAVARELDADYDAGRRRASLRYDPETEDATVIAAVREAL